MTEKQKNNYNKMLKALKKIARGYQTSNQIKRDSQKQYGLDYEEALEMSYDNIQEEARFALKGISEIKDPKQIPFKDAVKQGVINQQLTQDDTGNLEIQTIGTTNDNN